MRTLSALLLLCLPLWLGAQSSRAFKTFYQEGNELYESKQYLEAVKKYKEAHRLAPKATRYKLEGTFFANYLPQYRIALCYEHIDLEEAAAWVAKSENAVEESVIRRMKKDLAVYHEDLNRIKTKVKQYREDIKVRYNLKLAEAESLLNENRFEQAKVAYTALLDIDRKRTEAQVGLNKIPVARRNFLKGKALDVRTSIMDKRWDQATALVDQIEKIDPGYTEIASLRSRIANARAMAEKPIETTPVVSKPPPETKPKPRETKPVTPKPNPDRQAQLARQKAAERKETVRAALLDSLRAYRRGDPESALNQLAGIPTGQADDFGSYHWLKGVYLASAYHHQVDGDDSLLSQAKQEMARVSELLPDFQPDDALYPAFVVALYRETRQQRN